MLLADHAVNLERVAESMREGGVAVTTLVCDLSRRDEVEGLVERVEAESGPVDILVNNAGIGLGASILDTQEEDLRFLFEVNFFALQSLCQQALKRMATRRAGHIINVGSAAGRFGSPTIAAYSASKGAVHAYTQALRIEARVYDVQVCEVLPVSVNTPFFESVRGAKYRPGGVVLTPDRVARTIERAATHPNPPAELLPFGPVQLAFLFDSLFPGWLGRLAGRDYVRSQRRP